MKFSKFTDNSRYSRSKNHSRKTQMRHRKENRELRVLRGRKTTTEISRRHTDVKQNLELTAEAKI